MVAIGFQQLNAQPNTGVNHGRLNAVIITESIIATAGTIALHYLWYKKFPRSRFHLFNDNAEWLSMDKIGHATSAYNFSAIQYDMMRWSGVDNKKAAWVGGLTAIGLLTMIEIFDGFSSQWGFSKGDMLANITGSALFVAQQLAWGEQRARLKFSFHKTIYSKYNPAELGANKWQSWLKDYNGQTYWLSINPASFMKSNTSFPQWLNVNLGIGAGGMIGARTNPSKIGNITIPEFRRQHRYLFSIDADLRRIDNKNMDPHVLLSVPNSLKIPAPALEFKKDSAIKFHLLYF
ncbi:MAG: DUF2279 domain-containing protein [Chitinophagaceae bacterium]|nr:DUF2279 domain-containing protein [Chitinophagaceae bacterium]